MTTGDGGPAEGFTSDDGAGFGERGTGRLRAVIGDPYSFDVIDAGSTIFATKIAATAMTAVVRMLFMLGITDLPGVGNVPARH